MDGKQIIEMKVVGYQYEPHQFNIVQGIPVEWRVDATLAQGCGRVLLAPGAGVRKLLSYGTTVITFHAATDRRHSVQLRDGNDDAWLENNRARHPFGKIMPVATPPKQAEFSTDIMHFQRRNAA